MCHCDSGLYNTCVIVILGLTTQLLLSFLQLAARHRASDIADVAGLDAHAVPLEPVPMAEADTPARRPQPGQKAAAKKSG